MDVYYSLEENTLRGEISQNGERQTRRFQISVDLVDIAAQETLALFEFQYNLIFDDEIQIVFSYLFSPISYGYCDLFLECKIPAF